MGKTVGALLVLVVAVAIIAIPGVGQAIGGALVSAGLASSAAAGATLATSLAISLGISAIGMLLAPTPQFDPPENTASPIKTEIPPRMSCYGRRRLYGAYVLYENSDFSINSDTFAPLAIDVFAVHDGPIDGIEARYLGDKTIELGNSYGPQYVKFGENRSYGDRTVQWFETLGATPGTATFSAIQTALPGKWTNDHRGDGVVCIGIIWRPVSGDEFGERFPQGAAPASIVARWQKVYDWRDPGQDVSDPDTWEWSENAVLHLAHYRLVREKARKEAGAALPSADALQDAWDLFFAPTVDYWTEAADVCDEDVALKAGGTEKRYRSCFAHKHTDPHKAVIDALTTCFDGWTSPRADGALVVYAGKFYEPTVSIGPDQIVSYSWRYAIPDEESVNEIKINFPSPAHDYADVDADAWLDEIDMAERGAIRSQTINLQVPSHAQARRLVKRKFARMMASNRGVITTNMAGRIVRGQRYINLKIEEAGTIFFEGVAEITSLMRNVATGGVTFSWVEITPEIDSWNPATEEGEPPPVKESITLVKPDPPMIDTAALLLDPSGGGTGVRVVVTLSGPSGEDLIWFLRWRRVGDAVWNEQRYADVDSSSGVELISGFVPAGRDLEVQVAYASGTGALSDWSFPETEVDSDFTAVAPQAATEVRLLEWSDRLVVETDPILGASRYRWRFYDDDGVTLRRELFTSVPEAAYTKAQAHADGVQRDYVVTVAGVNAGGTGAIATSAILSNPAPAAPTSVAFGDGTSTSTVTFTPSGAADEVGFRIAYSTATGFDPATQGASFTAGGSPAYTPQLPASTYYGKVAAVDLWSSQLVNFSAQDSFVITPGSGGDPPPGDGGGGDAGGGGDRNIN